METNDFVIIGAGLSGLNCARLLKLKNDSLRIQILEKSKACGGRMATRRIGNIKFDHGAQFIKRKEDSKTLVAFWEQEQVAQDFPVADFAAIFALGGMTQLAKKLAEKLNINFNCKAMALKKESANWQIDLEQGESFRAKNIILTCPLPQSLEALKNSQIEYDPQLEKIKYQKSIVLMVEFNSDLGSEMVYKENWQDPFFSICSQKAKGLADSNAYTVVMNSLWSETHFEQTEDEITLLAQNLLKNAFPKHALLNLMVKKWRYSFPLQTWKREFEQVAPGIYLAGDAFGGPSLNGALRSSNSLVDQLAL